MEASAPTYSPTLPARWLFSPAFTRSVCLMGKAVEDRIIQEQLKQQDKEMQEVISESEGENDGDKKMPFFLPRKHSAKNYYTDSDYDCLLVVPCLLFL